MDVHAILGETSHRPWPLPRKPWALRMQWLDLAFLHWPVSQEAIRAIIPGPLTLDTFGGKAWIGVVPFLMRNVRMRLAPAIPTASDFAELNVRTYVRFGDRAGVLFFSLDAESQLAVTGARLSCNLPYFRAEMGVAREGAGVRYKSRRTHRGAASAEFSGQYQPTGPAALDTERDDGGLGRWLTERYCLFTVGRRGRVSRLDIHHLPWPLQPAAAEIETNTMAQAAGIALPDTPPLVHYSSRLDVVAWPPVSA